MGADAPEPSPLFVSRATSDSLSLSLARVTVREPGEVLELQSVVSSGRHKPEVCKRAATTPHPSHIVLFTVLAFFFIIIIFPRGVVVVKENSLCRPLRSPR